MAAFSVVAINVAWRTEKTWKFTETCMLFLKTKNSNKQQKHSGVLIPDEIKKIEKVESFFLLLEHMMIVIVACTKKYTRPEMTKTGFLD